MGDSARDIILASIGILLLFVLQGVNSGRTRVPASAWPFLFAGFLLVAVAQLLDLLDPTALSGMMISPATKTLLQVIMGSYLGFAILIIGAVTCVPTLIRDAGRRDEPDAADDKELSLALADHLAQEMLSSLLKSSLSGVLLVKAIRDRCREIVDFEILQVNEAAQQILGRPASRLLGRRVLAEFPCIRSIEPLGHMVSVVETGMPFRCVRLFDHDGRECWYKYVAVKLRDGLAVTFADVSDRKRVEERLRHAAVHDTLTGLPDRALFRQRLQDAIIRSKRSKDYLFAVLYLDFDQFKTINDTLGHEAGDQLLISIAERLERCLRSIQASSSNDDGHLPARMGGDEFVVLLDDIGGIDDAVQVAKQLQQELSGPHSIQGHEIVSTVSIGVVSSELGYDSADDIIRDADTAMYQAKAQGKARYVAFDGRMHHESVKRAELRRELRTAVEELAFELDFDPIVNLATGQLAGLEALVRWPRPTGGTLRHADFMSIAEELRLAIPIGEWMLSSGCEHLRDWRETFPFHAEFGINVGLSPQLLRHPSLVDDIAQVISRTEIPAESIHLEFTEQMLIDDGVDVGDLFRRLKELGLTIVLDGVGTGHLSLNCLQRHPIDILKIDGTFIAAVQNRRQYGAIARTIVELAHNLGMRVSAENVDTSEQLVLLQALDCDLGQGAVFSPPLGPPAVEERLRAGSRFKVAA